MMAAEMPMAKVSSPARHHSAGDQRLRSEPMRSEEHTSELQSLRHLVCRLLLEKKNRKTNQNERKRTAKPQPARQQMRSHGQRPNQHKHATPPKSIDHTPRAVAPSQKAILT